MYFDFLFIKKYVFFMKNIVILITNTRENTTNKQKCRKMTKFKEKMIEKTCLSIILVKNSKNIL